MTSLQPNYRFYATLLDAFEGYLHSDRIYQEYWGNSDFPGKTEEEFEREQFQGLIDRINRVPFDSEAADRGTAFNEIIDCLILGCRSERMEIASDRETATITAQYNNRQFTFPISLCREFADYYRGAIPQVLTTGILPTRYGAVELYGYIDELMPMSVHDIKTTGKYSVGKFRHHWQHLVYPYCLEQSGNPIYDFEYNVAALSFSRTDGRLLKAETFTESYHFDPERDTPRLVEHCERLIEFIEANRHLITDVKIFGG